MPRFYEVTFQVGGATLGYSVVANSMNDAITEGEILCRNSVGDQWKNEVSGSCVSAKSKAINSLLDSCFKGDNNA